MGMVARKHPIRRARTLTDHTTRNVWHLPQRHAHRLRAKLGIRQYAIEALNHIQIPSCVTINARSPTIPAPSRQ
jgi:hypothetical protein